MRLELTFHPGTGGLRSDDELTGVVLAGFSDLRNITIGRRKQNVTPGTIKSNTVKYSLDLHNLLNL